MAKSVALSFALLLFAGVLGAAPNHAQARTITLEVENMTCAVCPVTVRKSLEAVPGVERARADDQTHTATVTYDPSQTSPQALIRATTEAGYPSAVRQ